MPSGSMLSHGVWRSPAAHRDWRDYVFKLVWLYGAERTEHILAGKDRDTNDDLAAWRGLGR